MQIRVVRRPVSQDERGLEPMQVSLVSWRNLHGGRLDFNETFNIEPAPRDGQNPRTGGQRGTPLGVSPSVPKGLWSRRAQGTRRQKLDKVEVNSDWPLALKSVWSL
jgi:hypothetical protein